MKNSTSTYKQPNHPQSGSVHTSQEASQRHFARDDFEFGSLLGIGALAQVVHVRDTYTGEEYALKILDKKQLKRFGKVAQIINEKDMLAKMNHPSIVKLYFTFQDPTWLYLALELCSNGELAELIVRKGRLPLPLVKFYTGELVNILVYLRQLGVAHRDIKPENLFISDTGHLKLGDFDTAKVVIGMTSVSSENIEKRTERMNTFVGTAQYVSPEMLHDSAVAGFGSDLWALGCVVYQMLTGQPPFKSNSEYITFQKILATDYSFPTDVPYVGQSFVKDLLTLEPQDRLGFADIGDLTRHPLFNDLDIEDLPYQDPPLEGIVRLRKRRIRMTSEDSGVLNDELSSDDEENYIPSESDSFLDGDEFATQFSGIAPSSPSLIRCSTTAPVSADQTDGVSPSGELFRTTPVAANSSASGSLFKKADSSPALFALSKQRSRSCSNLHIMIEESSSVSGNSSPKRASSMASGTSCELLPASPTSSGMVPIMPVKSWASNRNLSSKPSVIVESLMARPPDDSFPSPADMPSVSGGGAPDSTSAAVEASSPTSAVALNNYLQRICASDERILMSGHVLKRRFFGSNRILVVTDLPRLLVLDPRTFRIVCEIPLLSTPVTNPTSELLSADIATASPTNASIGAAISFVSTNEFLIATESTSWRGEVLDGTAQAWVSLMLAMKQKALKAASGRPPRPFHRAVSPQELNTGKLLERGDFRSLDIMGSLYARGGASSDLPSQDELEAVAQARVNAALRLMKDNPGNLSPQQIVAAIERQRSNETDQSESQSDDPYKIDIDDAYFSRNRSKPRRRDDSSSCRLM